MTSPELKPLPNTQPDSAEPPASGLPPSESLDLGQPEVVAATELDRLLTAAVTSHDYLAHSLEQALNDGFDWQKIQALQQQQRRATTLLLHTLNRVVPPRFHDFVLARATRHEQLSYAYVDSLDPKEQRYQLQEAVTIFLTQYQAALQLYEQPQAADATDSRPRLEASVATLEYALHRLEDQYALARVLEQLMKTQPSGPGEGQSLFHYHFLSEVLTRNLTKLNGYQRLDLVRKLAVNAHADVLPAIRQLPVAEQDQFAGEMISRQHYYDPSIQEVLFQLLAGLPAEYQVQRIQKYVAELTLKEEDREQLSPFHSLHRLVSLLPAPKQAESIRTLTKKWYQHPFSRQNGDLQVQQITVLTPDPELQAELFWATVDPALPFSRRMAIAPTFLLEQAELSSLSMQLAKTWANQGLIDTAYLQRYAASYIRSEFLNEGKSIHRVIHLSQQYQLDVKLFQDLYQQIVGEYFGSERGMPRDITEAARFFDPVRLEDEWQNFDLDIQASHEYGEKTWRKEQSLIDLLQNHLDAQDYRHATLLAHRAFNQDGQHPGRGYSPYDLSRIITFSRRWPFNLQDTWSHFLIPHEYREREAELAAQLTAVEPPKPPQIDLLMRDDSGQEEWVSLDQIQLHPDSSIIIGVRFQDQGLGYDKGLNALFAPTKQGLDFLRGRFGQGAKMSMIALLRQNCQVQISSRAVVEDTGELIEWSGQPYLSAERGTVGFQGKQRRLLQPTDIEQTGTFTEVRFADAPGEVQATFRQVLDQRQGEGLGKYVLDYHPLRQTYVYGGLRTNTTVSVHPQMEQHHYVQGLEVPSLTGYDLAFSYNFGSGEILTGRDRTYIESREAMEKEVAAVWQGVTDLPALRALYQLWLTKETGFAQRKYSYESTRLAGEMRWSIDEQNRPAHLMVLLEHLKLNEPQPIVVASTSELQRHPQARQKLEQAGYQIVIELDLMQASHIQGILEKVLGPELALSFDQVWRQVEGIHDNEVFVPPTELRQQVELQLQQSLALVKESLRTLGRDEVIPAVEAMSLQVEYRYPHPQQRAPIEVISVPVANGEQSTPEELRLIIYPQLFTDGSDVPAELTAVQLKHLSFALDAILLRACPVIAVEGSYSFYRPFHAGQDLANSLLTAHAHQLPEAVALGEQIRVPVNEQSHHLASSESVMATDRQVAEVREVVLGLVHREHSLTELQTALGDLERSCQNDPDLLAWAVQACKNHRLLNRRYYDQTGVWILKIPDSEATTGLPQLELIGSQPVGELQGAPIFQVGHENTAALLVPVDFQLSEKVVLRVNGQSYPISKYRRQAASAVTQYTHNQPGMAEKFFAEQPDYFTELVGVESGMLVFPVGTHRPEVVAERVAFFTKSLPIELYYPGESEAEELNEGATYLSTNATTEYGAGKVWDDPIRIFGDILQNHLDAGKVTIRYRLENYPDLVDEARLQQPDFQDHHIVGIVIEDDGTGYTTQGLTRWGDSPKRDGGKRGRFGEGLKMLSVACARQKFALRCHSRNWGAEVTTKPQNMVIHGQQREVQVVGFNMTWSTESDSGSSTELSCPPQGTNARQNETWQQWMAVLDPRLGSGEQRHRGLARYVRELRSESEKLIKVGPVTFLLDEPGTIYERGLVVPKASSRLNRKLLFGYDFDAGVVATQERNVIDETIVSQYLVEAFRTAPYALCRAVMQRLKTVLASGNTLGSEANYWEFDLLEKVADIEVLRLAYHEVFGPQALLSSLQKAKQELDQGTRKRADGNYSALFEEERAFLEGLVEFEQFNIPSTGVVNFGTKYNGLAQRLEPHVYSTRGIFASLFNERLALTPEQDVQFQKFVQQVAAELFDIFNQLNQSESGHQVLEALMSAPDREVYPNGKLDLAADGLEYALKFLSLVGLGVIPIQVDVLPMVKGVCGFVRGSRDITYSAGTLEQPDKSVATTIHELIHLAFQTTDYNSTFYGLLLLANKQLAARYH